MLSVSSGYSPEYLLKEVATGRENYYTDAVSEGEPPGRWWGGGAEKLGLHGLVDAQDMRAVYERFLDPRDEAFKDPERWEGASTLGHTGRKYMSEDELYEWALEREPDASPERRAELRTEAGKASRHNVAFFDLTFSVQKSVTLLHTAFEAEEVKARRGGDEESAAAWGEYRRAVEDAIWAGNNAMLDYMTGKAGYSRVGHHGGAAGRYVDAHDWTVASFFQHDSRDHDPQLHVHNGTLNRVQCPDGEWRTIDGRSLYRWRAAGGAVGERTCEERITHSIGTWFRTRPDGKAREIVGVSQEAMDLISSRRRAVTAKAAELIATYEETTGRAANGLVRDRLQRQATFATRRAKSHEGETREQLIGRVEQQVRGEVAGGLAGVARSALGARENAPAPATWSRQAVIETALEEVQASKAGWTESDLIRALNTALPDYLGLPDGTDVAELLDRLATEALGYAQPLDGARPGDEALPPELRLANGASAYQAPGARLYATPGHVRTERALLAASARADGAALRPDQARRFLAELDESGIKLGEDQAAAVRGVLTSGARVETLVGPPGTGKSFVVGTIARGWTDPTTAADAPAAGAAAAGAAAPAVMPARRVFGLATSQIATEVLKAEGLAASNVAAWLGAQRRLAADPGSSGPRPRDADQAWRLHAGDLVVVDESAMTDTAALAAVHGHVEAAGAKLLLVGDHKQLAAVGAGGAMELIAQTAGARYELADARRFILPWEQTASLQLRAGDQSVLREYHKRGRLIDGGTLEETEAKAIRGWFGDTLSGKRSLLVVDTNEQAARVSAKIRAELVRLGHVDEGGVRLGLQGTYAGVGDLVEARALNWAVRDVEGKPRPAVTREHYRVQAVHPDGGLEVAVVRGRTEDGDVLGDRLVLPPEYVAEHLALGYASTKNAAQGATVDTSHTVATGRTSPAGLLVPMTRGRECNTAYVTTVAQVEDPAQGGQQHTVRRDPVAVLAGVLDNSEQADAANRSATATAAAAAAAAGSAQTAAELLADAAHLAATERTATWLDQIADKGWISPEQRARIASEDGAATLTRVLRRAELAGHDPYSVLQHAVAGDLDGARNTTNVIYSRIRAAHRFDPVAESFTDLVPRVDNPAWRDYLAELASAGDKRARELGEQAVADPPSWAVEALGRIPSDRLARQEWQRRAATIATYRELAGHDTHDAAESSADVLGRAPKPGQVEAYTAYRAAWRALGRPEIERAAYEMSDGQLRIQIRAWEREEAFGPRYVANELAGTRQAAASHRQTAALRAAEADAAADPTEQDRLRQEAAEAAALADTLDTRAEQLEEIDDARATFLAHTATTRANAEEARFVLAERQADAVPEQQVTAQEWLDAARAAAAAEDRHREILDETELADLTAARDADLSDAVPATDAETDEEAAAVEDQADGQPVDAQDEVEDEVVIEDRAEDDAVLDEVEAGGRADPVDDHPEAVADEPDTHEVVLETAVEDIRDTAAEEPSPRDEDVVRVPAAEETAADIEHARRALYEIQARQAEEEREAAEQREQQLAQWHADDTAAGGAGVDDDATADGLGDDAGEDGSVLEYEPPVPAAG
ncbi:MobF family relaxase [Pseudonocardia sichuanensis]